MKDRLDLLVQNIKDDFTAHYMKKRVVNKEGLNALKNDIQMMLDKYCYKYGIDLEPVEVTAIDGTVAVDLMRAFKKYPKLMQMQIACQIAGVDMDDVVAFGWHSEGYIIGMELKYKPFAALHEIEVKNET